LYLGVPLRDKSAGGNIFRNNRPERSLESYENAKREALRK